MQPLIVLTAQVRKRHPPMLSWSAQVHNVIWCGRQPWLEQLKLWKATRCRGPGLLCHRQPKWVTCWDPQPSFPRLEVERRLRGDSTQDLVQEPSGLNKGLCTGHVGLRDALIADVKTRLDDKKSLAKDVRALGQAQGTHGAAPARRRPRGGVPAPHTVLAGGFRACEVACACQWVTSWVRTAPVT